MKFLAYMVPFFFLGFYNGSCYPFLLLDVLIQNFLLHQLFFSNVSSGNAYTFYLAGFKNRCRRKINPDSGAIFYFIRTVILNTFPIQYLCDNFLKEFFS